MIILILNKKINNKLAYLVPGNRLQISFSSLEEHLESENPIRFIDVFKVHPYLKRLATKTNTAQMHKHLG